MPIRLVRTLALIVATCLAALPALAAEKITVFAAASLKNALDDAVTAYRAKSGRTVVVSYAASSMLAKQIEKGAPADVFISADEDWMNYLAKKDLLDSATRKNLFGGHLVLIAPAKQLPANPITFPGDSLVKALRAGRLAMADVASVPAGKYGKASLETLGLWEALKTRVAQAENVRSALAYVSRGETPLGIVYGTDAVADPKVKIIATFPDNSHAPIIYPGAALKRAPAGADAAAFLSFIGSPEAAPIFEKQGFEVKR